MSGSLLHSESGECPRLRERRRRVWCAEYSQDEGGRVGSGADPDGDGKQGTYCDPFYYGARTAEHIGAGRNSCDALRVILCDPKFADLQKLGVFPK